MRAKTLILLFVALGCGMIAAVAVSKAVMEKSPGESAEPTTEIFVAVKKLITTEKITPDKVRLEKWPTKRLPEEVLTDLEQFENWYPKIEILSPRSRSSESPRATEGSCKRRTGRPFTS